MTSAWADEDQLTLLTSDCRCYGRLGCGHDMPWARGRLNPAQPDFDAVILEAGGFDLMTVPVRAQRPIDLPTVMPVVDGTHVSRSVMRPAVAVLLKDWPSPDAMRARLESPHQWLGLPQNVRILLTMFGRDADLERLWRDRYAFVRALDGFAPSAVIGPSFSTWNGDLWMEHRYQMQRSLEMVRLLQDHGHLAIPHIAWGRSLDAGDVADWINMNDVAVVAVDGQCLRDTFPRWLSQLAWLRKRLSHRTVLVVSGIHGARQLRDLFEVWPDTCIVYNGLRTAGSHRELRQAESGMFVRVRHTPPIDAERPSLWLPGPEADPAPNSLYARSLRVLERALPESTPAARAGSEPSAASVRRDVARGVRVRG